MRRHWLLWAAVFSLTAAVNTSAFAQDSLANIVKKNDLSQRDRARIQAEVPLRVKRLEEAGADDKARERARERLVATAKVKGASRAGLDVYAAAVSHALEPLTKTKKSSLGLDVTNILIELNNPNTATALAAALESTLPEVRYRAARGIDILHKGIAADERLTRTVLSALGKAGKNETSDLALRMIYEAIDFQADVKNFKYGRQQADALVRIFAERIAQMQSGNIDQSIDITGIETAAQAYPDTDSLQKSQLMNCLLAYLEAAVARYFDDDSSDEARPLIALRVQRIENAMHSMIAASKADAPRDKIGDILRGKSALGAKRQSVIRAKEALLKVLSGDPWRID